MRAFLVQGDIYDPATQAPRAVRWTNAVDQTIYGGALYDQGLVSIPEITSEISWDGDFGGGSKSSVSSLVYSMNQRDRDYLARLMWEGSQITILRGAEGGAIGDFEQLCVLEVQSASLSDYQLTLEFRDWRDKMLVPLTRRYAGSGGYEGTANEQGRVLPRGFGTVRSGVAEYVKKSTFVRRFAQGPINSVIKVQSRGVDIPVEASVIGLAALEALVITPGMCAVDVTSGALRSRLELSEPVTVTFLGENSGGYVGGVIAIARKLMSGIAPERGTDWADLDVLQPALGQLYLSGNETLADALDQLLLGLGCWWGVDVTSGAIECGRLDFSAPLATLVADDVTDIEMESAKAPFWQRRLAFGVNNRPLADGEIAVAIIDQDARNDAAAALQAASTAAANAATALQQAQGVLARVNDISNDGLLDADEKLQLVRIYADITNEYGVIDAAAAAFGVFGSRTTYQAAKSALDAYLAGLTPAITNYALTTAVVRTTLNGKFNDYYFARAVLLDAFPAIAATTAQWNKVVGVGRPEDDATNDRGVDTRFDNFQPSYYRANFLRRVRQEFKDAGTIGAPNAGNYGTTYTYAPWQDDSGGPVIQQFETADGIYLRRGLSSGWGAWVKSYDSQNKPRLGGDLLSQGGFTLGDGDLRNDAFIVNPDGTVAYFNGANFINVGAVTIGGLGFTGDLNATANISAGIHNSALSYARGTFVRTASGDATYIAKSLVPVGIALTNTVYWDLFVVGGGGAPGENARDFLVQPGIVSVETDANGNGGTFPRAAQLKYYDGTVDKTASGQVVYNVVGAPSWASVNANGVISISDFGAAFEVQFDASYSGQTRRVTMALAKQRAGLPGGVAKAIDLITDRSLITFNGNGVLSPSAQTTTFTVAKQNTNAAVAWTAARLDGTVINPVTDLLSAASGDSVTMSAAAFAAQVSGAGGVLITATVIDGPVLRDTASVVKVQDGPPGAGEAGTLALTENFVSSFPFAGDSVLASVVIKATSSTIRVEGFVSWGVDIRTTPEFRVVAITPNGTIEAIPFTFGIVTFPIDLGEFGYSASGYFAFAVSIPTYIAASRIEDWTLQIRGRGGATVSVPSNLQVRY